MEKQGHGLVYRTSRIYYFTNYVIVALVVIILAILYPMLNIFTNLLHLALFFGIMAIGAGFAEQPEWEILFKKYIVTNNEIMKLEGILNKRKTVIPFQNVSDITVTKTFNERIFKIGTVHVRGFKEGADIILKGMRDPDEVQGIIQEKINLIRDKTMKASRDKK